jgi:hypothetical protein
MKMAADSLVGATHFNLSYSVISNYLAWKIVYGLIEVLPSKYGKLHSTYRGGQIKPKWDSCVQETSKTLPLETTLIFVQHALQKGTVEKVSCKFSVLKLTCW